MKKLIWSTALLLGAAGFVSAQHNETETRHDMHHMMQMMQNCPMRVQGAEVAVADTPGGVALTITTASNNVDELRRRVEIMAKMHNAAENKSPMMRGRMISAAVKYDEVPNGARITLTPTDPAQLEELRKQVRAHAERMKKGECPMMRETPVGNEKTEPAPKDDNHDPHHPN